METELNTIKVGIGAEVARLVLLELLCSISARPVLEDDTTLRCEGFFIFRGNGKNRPIFRERARRGWRE